MNGNIPMSEILSYANGFELISSLEEFVEVILMIDSVYAKISKNKKDKEKEKEDKGKSNGKQRNNPPV